MRKTRGFTLIELMLSMSFLSVLLIMIALLTIQVSNIYTKGITLKAVNQAGIELTSELRTTLNQASADQISDQIDMSGKGGRLCTGTFSYAWNYGQTISGSETEQNGANRYENSSAPYDIRFVKVADTGGLLCQPQDGAYPSIDQTKATELLAKGDRNLVLHSVKISSQDITGGQMMYWVQLVIGTNNQDEFITGQTKCKPPSAGFDEFCAVNKLEFTARAGNIKAGS